MAIKRFAIVTCDGPCGTSFQSDKVPEDWHYVQIRPVVEKKGEPSKAKKAALCPKCTERFLAQNKNIAFTEPQEHAATGEIQ